MGDVASSPFRETKPPEPGLLDREPDWRKAWWGMPHFEAGDCRPHRKVVVNFATAADMKAFAKLTGLTVGPRTDTVWYPAQPKLGGAWYFDGPETSTKYPVCIPSKGRAAIQKTGLALDRMGVEYKFFVEETEYDAYCDRLGPDRVVRMPFHDLGRGSILARNFIWEWAVERGVKRHWVVDDNIRRFHRCTRNRRLRVFGGGFFRAMEDFVDRYENVALAGPHGLGFATDRSPTLPPFRLNSRVYSCILVDTSLPHRWRGRHNEDTDLSLRLLKDGYCTVLFNAFLMNKEATSYGDGKRTGMAGGNTDTVYAGNDHRREFAESLQRQHPDVVKVVWKYHRWHHEVDYSRFRRNRLRLRPGVVPTAEGDEYGMELIGPKAGDAEK